MAWCVRWYEWLQEQEQEQEEGLGRQQDHVRGRV